MDFRCSRAPQQAFGLGSRTTTKASIMFACAYITGSCNACRSYNTISKESLPASRRRPPTMSRLSVAKAYFALCFLFFAGLVTANQVRCHQAREHSDHHTSRDAYLHHPSPGYHHANSNCHSPQCNSNSRNDFEKYYYRSADTGTTLFVHLASFARLETGN
jgi:hypothetical protein